MRGLRSGGRIGPMTSGPRVVQKFHPNTGVFTGYVGIGVAVIVLGTLVFQARDSEGLQYGLGVLLAAAAVWVTILRPRAYALAERGRQRTGR